MKYTLTEDHFKYFVDRCEYYKHLLCIPCDIAYTFEIIKARADSCVDTSNHMGNIRLCKTWNMEVDNKNLNTIAFHEICHVLLDTLTTLAGRYYSFEYISELEHAVLISLENLVK